MIMFRISIVSYKLSLCLLFKMLANTAKKPLSTRRRMQYANIAFVVCCGGDDGYH